MSTLSLVGRSTRMHRIMRSTIAALAAAACVSTISPVVAQPVNPSDEEITAATQAVGTAESHVSALAVQLSSAESAIAELELRMGQLREAVNKALVDLHDAQAKAEQARQGVSAARANLDATQSEIIDAQAQLDEISRTAYRQGTTPNGVSAISGNGNSEDSLDRQTYLRTTAQTQRAAIDELDRLRTEQANEESKLREARNLAEKREQEATTAQEHAQSAINENSAALAGQQEQMAQLTADRDAAQVQLDVARGNITVLNTQRSDYEEYEAAEAARKVAEEEARAAESSRQAAEEAQKVAEAAEAEAMRQAAEKTAAEERAAAQAKAEQAAAEAEAARQRAQQEAADEQAARDASAAAAAAASAAAAAIIAANTATHATTEDPYTDTEDTSIAAVQNPNLSDTLASVLKDLDVVTLDTDTSVSEKATSIISDASRDTKIETVISRAMGVVGTPYAWGGGDANGPTRGIRDGGVADSYGDYNKVGFDCSGLVLYAFAGAGISLPHYSGYQYQRGTQISPQNIQRGDLIFYGPNAEHHVAIYLGDGQMIEAPNSGSTVRISPVRWSGMSPYAVRMF
ncbi:cell wall-associated hydrolase resuscitation promoting factor interacting protein [Corynebacterium kutscheri]|uniref:Cell wall-associated hydrolase, invasion-associated protein n=2 Tax=Corynebacterium kutscheri TaxID=35755 RepID=A0A0F6QZM1_9CORY|nr:cell wall-associated hydrolase, invasion-associated protein [Corynebacterium kutscheri]VEH09569.1 cell wall-associated hydrolase resuscitation promoting factor interacting protein [Corynebacterium kutscheri]VEH79652.1 cell wall-associated hydrolase resuscitation promoting factor interacting protein [Corynebacterium kutscheri]